jgi:subtilisin
LPNLTPFQPSGWSDKIVVSTTTGTHADGSPLHPTDTLFVDLAVLNNGSAATASSFIIKLYVDGVEKGSFQDNPPLDVNFYGAVDDFSIGSLSVGLHTLRVVADVFNTISESNEFDNEYTKTINVVSAGLPNLTPFQPSGWSDKIVVSTTTGAHADSSPLRPTDTLFVDLAILNNGSAATAAIFIIKLYVDGVEKGSFQDSPPLDVNFYGAVDDFPIGSLGAGTHTLRIVADFFNTIGESNEFDNEYTKTITVASPTLPNLTPAQPSGWSDKIVVSTTTGTHADSAALRPSDTLFVDLAVLNNGSAATASSFIIKLYVDGVEKGSFQDNPPLNSNFLGVIEDFSIGSLSAGSHTLRVVADVFNTISESNEFDNEYTRTISVSQTQCAALTVNVSPSEGGTVSHPAENCSGLLELPAEPGAALQPASVMSTSRVSSEEAGRPAAMAETFRALISKAEAKDSVLVIVGLRTVFQPEGALSTPAIHSQHNAIAQVQDVLLARMSAFNVQSVKRYATVPYLAMKVDAAGLAHLESSADVISIMEDVAVPPSLAESVPLIGAPNAWAAGYTGAGQTVVILDSGVDKNHPFLAGKVVSEACYSTPNSNSSSVCPGGVSQSISVGSGINCNTAQMEGCFHGTHVAGIAAGRGTSFSGVAKDANIIAIQVFSRFDSDSDCNNSAPCVLSHVSDQMMGLERVIALAGSFSIAAVNMSLGGGRSTTTCDSDPRKSLIDNLRSLGIATVISAGNEEYVDAMGAPACISSAISVGSTGDGSGLTTRDVVSGFSNSASFLKLLAPGSSITSSVPGGTFGNASGTSMAAPHVTGAWALLKGKSPSASVDQIFAALNNTGVPITDFRNGIVKPRIQVDAAINALGGGGGTVLRYGSNNTVALTANANPGFAFVKWQQDGVDFSNSPTVNVQMNLSHAMMAVFRAANSTTIGNIVLPSGKLVIIDGSGFGSFPTVIINDVDRSVYITGASNTTITMKGKRKKMGLRAGNNTVRVIGPNGASNVFIVPIF